VKVAVVIVVAHNLAVNNVFVSLCFVVQAQIDYF